MASNVTVGLRCHHCDEVYDEPQVQVQTTKTGLEQICDRCNRPSRPESIKRW